MSSIPDHLPPQKSVLVTGASSGIGYEVAIRLAKESQFLVYAAVRKQTDFNRLKDLKIANLRTVLMDVQDLNSIEAAVQTIGSDSDAPLTAIVNNAGIAVAGPLEFLKISEIEKQFDINVFGMLRVTQKFLPLLRKSQGRIQGRIVNISSISGKVAPPFMSSYAASKHAVEAISDGLRRELSHWNIQVAIIEPGMVQTPIWKASTDETLEFLKSAPEECRELYGETMHSLLSSIQSTIKSSSTPDDVYRAVSHALCATQPKTRYLVGRDAKMANLLRHLPDRWFDKVLLRVRLKNVKSKS